MLTFQLDYTVNGQTASSPPFNITFSNEAQYVTVLYQPGADAVLNQAFPNPADVTMIKDRVRQNLATLLSQRTGARVVIGTPPANVSATSVRVEGSGTGGHCAFDLVNRSRGGLCTIHIGPGSLDVANTMDPVSSTSTNERRNRLRVADAIARLAAHEAGHAMGLVPQSAEIASDALAIKLNVNSLLSGTASHHNSSSSSGVNIMYSTNNISLDRAWNISLYDFSGNEKTYLMRILP